MIFLEIPYLNAYTGVKHTFYFIGSMYGRPNKDDKKPIDWLKTAWPDDEEDSVPMTKLHISHNF